MVDETPPKLSDYQKLLEQKLSADMDYARSLVKHNGERGRIVELVFKKVLERHLPEAFGVTTGFAIDQHSQLSKQLDLIVYDKSKCPFFYNEGVSVLPVEAVILTIEVKTTLNKRAFDDTREKARSLLDLDRSAIIPQQQLFRGPYSDKNGHHIPMCLGVSLDAVDTKELLAGVPGEEIEPLFVSMDCKCLINGSNPDGSVGWTYELDYPAAMFVLLASMMTSQAQMLPIDVTKYIKVNPKR